MKLFIFAFAIACILQDYGTMQQGRSVDAASKTKRIELFKKYAADVVAAAIPILRGNPDILEGGCECSLATDENLSPIDAVLATMLIAKDHPKDVVAIKDAENVSSVPVDEVLAENIRKILVVLETPPDNLDTLTMQKVVEKYVLHISKRDAGEEPYLKCARLVLSFYYSKNYNFFWGLYRGLEIASAQMRANVADPKKDERWNELSTIIDGLGKCALDTPDKKYQQEAYNLIDKWLKGEIEADSKSQ